LGLTSSVAAVLEKIRIANELEDALRRSEAEAILAGQIGDIQAIEHEGDRYLALENFDRARELYRQAQLAFQGLGLTDMANAVREKIRIADELEAAIRRGAEEAELARQILEIQSTEHEGDRYLAAGNFNRARELYRQAQLAYQRLGLTDRASIVQDKIRNADELEAAARQAEDEAELARQMMLFQGIEQEGDHYLSMGNFERARTLFRQAQLGFQQLGQTDRVLALQNKIGLANEMEATFRQEQEEAARQEARLEAETALSVGTQLMFVGDYETALERFRRARELFLQLGEIIQATYAQQGITDAETAIRELEQVRVIEEAENAIWRGNQFMGMNLYADALAEFTRARELYLQINDFANATYAQTRMFEAEMALADDDDDDPDCPDYPYCYDPYCPYCYPYPPYP